VCARRGVLLAMLVVSLLGRASAVDAQAEKIHRVGVLGATSASAYAVYLEAFRQGLRDVGYTEGKNVVIESRWAEGKYERLPGLATELVQSKVEVIVTHGPVGARAAKEATKTVPIVMATVGDAVAVGLVASLSRPGGNVTGSTFFWSEFGVKRLELLKEVFPSITRVAVLTNPDNPNFRGELRSALDSAARSLRIELNHVDARGPDDFERAFSTMAKWRADALMVFEDAVFISHAKRIAELSTKSQLRTIGFAEYAEAGGLMAFGVSFTGLWRRAAVFVDKILKGAKPADLPVERPVKFELIVNRKAAKALGLTLPPSLLARADRVIE
jgi:putative tryptophan/tyrosine transport system substrate-binding protein